MTELSRVLRPGGRAVFQENQLTNSLLRFAWVHLTGNPLVAKFSSPDEFPLVGADCRAMRGVFPVVKLHYPQFQMLSMANRSVFRHHPRWQLVMRTLTGVDETLARLIPPCAPTGSGVWSSWKSSLDPPSRRAMAHSPPEASRCAVACRCEFP